jgi:hypothetical protein
MKKALIIGIDHYKAEITNLNSCVSSAKSISKLLSRNEGLNATEGDLNFDCKVLTSSEKSDSPQITRVALKENCKALFEDEEADIALFYFSGYGFNDQLGVYLVTEDNEQYDEGVSLSDLMIYANNSSIKEINIILDNHFINEYQDKGVVENQFAFLRKGISILSVKNYKNKKTNLFAELMETTLKGANADILGHVTFIEIYEQTVDILNGLNYSVTFKSNASRLTVLRKTIPKISYANLSNIRSYFKSPHYRFSLDKEHIPSQKLGKIDKQKDYKNLQQMVKYGLVKPVNADHLYYAAFNEKHCKLTQRGQQYWDLLERKRI